MIVTPPHEETHPLKLPLGTNTPCHVLQWSSDAPISNLRGWHRDYPNPQPHVMNSVPSANVDAYADAGPGNPSVLGYFPVRSSWNRLVVVKRACRGWEVKTQKHIPWVIEVTLFTLEQYHITQYLSTTYGSCSISASVSSSQPWCWLWGICGAEVLMGHVSWAAWSHSKGSPPGYIPCGTPHRSRHWVLKAQWMHLIFVNVRIWYVINLVKYICTFLFSYIFL